MLALVGLEAPSFEAAQPVVDLPDPPAIQWTAFLVHCKDLEAVLRLVDWTKRMRVLRPRVPVGIAFSRAAAGAASVAAEALNLEPLLEIQVACIHDKTPLKIMVRAAIEGRIVDEWFNRWPAAKGDLDDFLHVLAAHSVRGAGLSKVCRSLGKHESTLYRRMTKLGLPPPSRLWSEARIRSVALRREYGISLRAAVSSAGWMSVENYRKALRRLQFNGDGSDPAAIA